MTWSWMPHCVIPKQSRPVWHPIQETLQPALASLPSFLASLPPSNSLERERYQTPRSFDAARQADADADGEADRRRGGGAWSAWIAANSGLVSVRPSRRRRRRTRSVGRCISLVWRNMFVSLGLPRFDLCLCSVRVNVAFSLLFPHVYVYREW